MIGLLESAAAAAPDQTAVVGPDGPTTYATLLHGARHVAVALRRRRITRFAIAEPDVTHVIQLLAGAALAGAEPCQYQADLAAIEVAEQSRALGHAVIVTTRQDLHPAGPEIVPPEVLLAEPAPPTGPPAAGASQPLLILTTGTTGRPKPARHDWTVLGRTVARVRPRPEQRWLMAYGPHQFAGVQVLQHVLATRATLVAPFPRQPCDGLDALLHDGVTCISATPTYWRFMLAEARSRGLTLPPLEQITLGGEAIPPDLLDELRSRFPVARISQIYASTEFGSVASVRDGQPGFAVDALHSKRNPTSNLRVVDGELWVRATAGMLGYADGDAGAEPVTDMDAAAWRPTGDLVEIVGGRVAFRGRTTEVINVGGSKVHPLPIENAIARLPRVALARVYGRPNRLTGAIVAVDVVPVDGLDDTDLEQLRRDIKAAVVGLPRAAQPRSITFVDAIETRGDKTIRKVEA